MDATSGKLGRYGDRVRGVQNAVARKGAQRRKGAKSNAERSFSQRSRGAQSSNDDLVGAIAQ